MKESEVQIDFQNSVYDTDELDIPENKINPQYYIHNAIIKVQNAYDGVAVTEGITRFILAVDQLECLLIAKGLLEHYKSELDKQLEESKVNELTGNIVNNVSKKDLRISQIKFKVLLGEVFSHTKEFNKLKV